MIDRKTAVLIAMLGVGMLFAAVGASAASSFGDGDYTLELPGVGEFEFVVDTDATDVAAVDAPAGYEVDEGADTVAWKAAAQARASVPDIEVKPDVIEAGVTWVEGPVTLTLPDGSITISEPDEAGEFTVTTDGELWAFGGGVEWYVANDQSLRLARSFFKIEANSRGVKIKAVKSVDPAFLRALDHDEQKGQGKGRPGDVEENRGSNNGRGRGSG